jgi:glutamate-1-semialdehyde aminotransferase
MRMTHSVEFSPTGMIRGALSSRYDQALSALESRTAHSWMMALDRAKVLPDSTVRQTSSSVRLFVRGGAGAHVTDVDGTSFIDLSLGNGTQILGHAHPIVQQAIVTQCARGWQFDLPADGQLELARLIQTAGAANERVALTSTGVEAVDYAVRAARAFTGKAGIAVFTGSAQRRNDIDEVTAILPYGHPAAIDQIRRRRQELAAVMIEPVRAGDPNLDRAAWLHSVMEACRAAGVLLILDERQTGFRLAYGGAQEIFGLMPDLVVYGRAIGGGLPLGAIAGRTEVMAAPSDNATSPLGSQPSGVNPLSVTAGIATLGYLHDNRAALYPALNSAGRVLAEHINAFARDEGIPVEMRCAGSIFRLSLAGAVQAESIFNVLMLSRGVLTLPGQRGFLSTAHTAADMERVRESITGSLKDLRDDGVFSQN